MKRDSDDIPKNVLGGILLPCSERPLTGFYRDGCCNTGEEDVGAHLVCVRVTREFLDFSLAHGNDLVTAHPESGFPGLKPGDRWCVCAARWVGALAAGVAAPIALSATHESMIEYVSLAILKQHAIDLH